MSLGATAHMDVVSESHMEISVFQYANSVPNKS